MTEFLNGFESRRYRQVFGLVMFLLLVALVSFRLQGFFSPDQFNEEFRILYHFDSAKTNSKDYSGEFLSQLPQPVLYVWMTKAVLALGVDLEIFHRLLGAICFLLFLAGTGVAALRVGGLFALTVTALSASQIIFYQQTSSATPHAFAFPLLAWSFVSLLYAKPYFGGILTVLASMLYVPVAPLIGLMFAAQLIMSRRVLSRTSGQNILNFGFLLAVALVSIALVVTQLQSIDGYGAALTPGERLEQYPENGPHGRYHLSVFEPGYHVVSSALGQFHQEVPPLIAAFLFALVGVFAALGFYNLKDRPDTLQSTLIYVISSVLVFCVVVTLRHYLSYRFALYPLFTILSFLFVYGLNSVLFRNTRRSRSALTIFCSSILVLCFALGMAKDNQTNGWLILTKSDREMLEFLSRTPPDSLVAAWPNLAASSLIPYVAGRPLLVDMKVHYPSYEGHLLEMRERMYALIDAHFASSIVSVKALNCRWGVDYLVFDRTLLSGKNSRLSYFAPFDQRIRDFQETAASREMALLELPEEALAYSSSQYNIVDLDFLIGSTDCEESLR